MGFHFLSKDGIGATFVILDNLGPTFRNLPYSGFENRTKILTCPRQRLHHGAGSLALSALTFFGHHPNPCINPKFLPNPNSSHSQTDRNQKNPPPNPTHFDSSILHPYVKPLAILLLNPSSVNVRHGFRQIHADTISGPCFGFSHLLFLLSSWSTKPASLLCRLCSVSVSRQIAAGISF